MNRAIQVAATLAAAVTAATPSAGRAQAPQPATFDFSIANMMRGPETYGREPSNVRWSPDGRWIYFSWLEPGSAWHETTRPYRVSATAGSRPEPVTRAHADSVAPLLERGPTSADGRLRVVSVRGDLYVIDLQRSTARRLTETLVEETSPSWSADAREIYFVRENNVYSIALDGGLVRQLTDIRPGPAPRDEPPAAGQRGALVDQQRTLFDAIRVRSLRDSLAREEQRSRDADRLKTLYLQPRERVAGISVSPNGKALLITTAIPDERALSTRVPNYVTETGYTGDLTSRAKVGDFQSSGRVAFMSLPSGEARFLTLAADTTETPSSTSMLGWNDDGSMALVFSVARNFKERRLHVVSIDGSIRLVDTLRDSAWVAGPCFSCGGWLDGGSTIYFVSEADGFAHLYSVKSDGTDRRQLTSGRWEVLGASLSRDRRTFYLTTNEGTPFEQHIYRMGAAGGRREKITTRVGGHTAVVSPDETMLAVVHSTANRPPELFVMQNRAGAQMAQLTTSPTAVWLSFPWIVPEIVMIPASDGVDVPARIYRPADVRAAGRPAAQPNGAGVIFVHGAGYLHNVHNYWSTYAREYMFNQYLASRGYVVLDIDYRGSAGYGGDWRTAIYRWMGGRDLQDHVDGSRYLQRQFGIDPERVGIYGGSYGGFITLMALFTEPKWFGAGAALRSVTDWAHYNHGYTSRILNLPDSDTLAYRRSSPIYFAEGLEDPLLMLHGMVDVNVHFSDVVRLAQRLIELGKTDWDLAVYPVEDHAFVRPDSWTDEYGRIFGLFERTIGRPR